MSRPPSRSLGSGHPLTISMPNLPGMVPNKMGWIYREKEGFKKTTRPDTASSEYQSRPGSAMGSPIKFTDSQAKPGNDTLPNVDSYREALLTGTQRLYNNTGRPSTAGPTPTYRGATPLFTGIDFNPQYEDDPGAHSRPATGKMPTFVEMDKQVCRFFAHFFQDRNWDKQAPLGDPNIENQICRAVTIQYYLSDNEVQILEPKVTNAGMPSGTFFRKGPLTKDDGSRLELQELTVGGEIAMLGQTFFITDADKFTRNHFEQNFGIELMHSLPHPKTIRKEMGAQYATGLGANLPRVGKQNYGARSTDYLSTKEVLDKTTRFLKYEGHVLRFQCVEVSTKIPPFFPHLQDIATQEGYYGLVASADVKRFALSFYLSTCNIDLVVQKQKGKNMDGQDEPKLVLKKSKLPTNWREAQRGRPAKYFEAEDFRCGQVIDVYGKYFLLVNCDSFTRQVYAQLGKPQRDVKLVSEPKKEIVQPIPQLGDGFLAIGSNEDTLATVYGMPKAGKDMEKMQRNQNRLLRCKAIMLTGNPIDSSREFMVTFYLEDDTLAVFEEQKRNSGIWGGNFLKRGRYLNALPAETEVPRYFKQNDIFLGNVVSVNGHEFQIIEMDNMSLDFCEHYPDEFPMMDTFKIIGSLMQVIVDRKLDMRPAFQHADHAGQGWLDQAKFVEVLDSMNLTDDLNDQEVLTLMRRFKSGDRYIYEEMCDLVSHVYAKNKSTAAMTSLGTRKKTVASEHTTMEQFRSTARARTIQWRRTLRKDPQTIDGFLTLAILEKLFKKHGLILKENILAEIKELYSVDKKKNEALLKQLQNLGAEHLYEGLDQKVRPKKKHSSTSSAKTLSSTNVHQQAIDRKNKNLVSSVLRRSSNLGADGNDLATLSASDSAGLENPAKILIDYHALCDDIYVVDWL
mmetsp:Transcript_10981/g.17895  ORF Transcript_10981/g.17895 Transcript_10981/m.17895 type:complete len:906 (+) Transcript_10981:76-2793(+)